MPARKGKIQEGRRPPSVAGGLLYQFDFLLPSCDAICYPQMIPCHSKKPLQKGHPKRPSDKAITHSAQGRLATHSHFATHLAGQRMSFCYKSDLRCASLSAHESGIFELLRQLYPARLLFFAVEKKSVAARRRHRRSQRIKGNKRCCRTKRLRQATHDSVQNVCSQFHP